MKTQYNTRITKTSERKKTEYQAYIVLMSEKVIGASYHDTKQEAESDLELQLANRIGSRYSDSILVTVHGKRIPVIVSYQDTVDSQGKRDVNRTYHVMRQSDGYLMHIRKCTSDGVVLPSVTAMVEKRVDEKGIEDILTVGE